jgi:hypothetical protein
MNQSITSRDQLYQYKGNKCGSCGKTVEVIMERWGSVKRMFEFNHIVPSKKHGNYK